MRISDSKHILTLILIQYLCEHKVFGYVLASMSFSILFIITVCREEAGANQSRLWVRCGVQFKCESFGHF